MKTVLAGLGALALGAMADVADEIAKIICDSDPDRFCLDKADPEECRQNFSLIKSVQFCDERRSRAFTNNPWSANIVETINGYGCWCYFDEDVDEEKGRGAPVAGNPVDSHCKELLHGYYCMKFDAREEDDTDCDPTNTEFVSATGLAITQSTNSKHHAIWEACKSMNGGDSNCASRACAVEGFFILNIFDLFLSGNQLDMSYKHTYGIHHPVEDCPRLFNPGTFKEYVCCGEYPLRFRHQVRHGEDKTCCGGHLIDTDGDRACCDDFSTYDKNTMQCCNEGFRSEREGRVTSLDNTCN